MIAAGPVVISFDEIKIGIKGVEVVVLIIFCFAKVISRH
jgi:hypothetical protein